MSALLKYQDTATFVKVIASGYANSKTSQQQIDVPVIFLQNTGFERSSFRETVDSDAICFPDPENAFIIANSNRLEGMYILAPLFNVEEDEGWYKIVAVTVNRDHLLNNEIDNIELALKKTRKIPGVS